MFNRNWGQWNNALSPLKFNLIHNYIFKILKCIYSRAPKSECSDFGAQNFSSVVKQFGFQTMSEIQTILFRFRTIVKVWNPNYKLSVWYWAFKRPKSKPNRFGTGLEPVLSYLSDTKLVPNRLDIIFLNTKPDPNRFGTELVQISDVRAHLVWILNVWFNLLWNQTYEVQMFWLVLIVRNPKGLKSEHEKVQISACAKIRTLDFGHLLYCTYVQIMPLPAGLASSEGERLLLNFSAA